MKHPLHITLSILTLFVIAQLIGILVIGLYVDREQTNKTGVTVWKDLPNIGGVGVERPIATPNVSVAMIVIAIIFGTVLALILLHFSWIRVWKSWFFFALLLGMTISLSAFVFFSMAFSIALLLVLLRMFFPNVVTHNLVELLMYPGISAIFVPILNIQSTIILLIIISLYDAYAVWKSKHMIVLAKLQSKAGNFAGLFLPVKDSDAKKYSGEKMQKMHIASSSAFNSSEDSSKIAGNSSVVKHQRIALLGGGDIAFPQIFAGVVFIQSGLLTSLFSIAGATLGLFVLLIIGKKNRFYPAMPFITAGCLFGWAIGLLILFIINFHY